MENAMWELQKQINRNNNDMIGALTRVINEMNIVIADQNRDLNIMHEHISQLQKEISELKGSR